MAPGSFFCLSSRERFAVETTGNGRIQFDATREINLRPGAVLQVVDGGVALRSNQDPPDPLGSSNGVLMDGATVQATGSANISLRGPDSSEAL
jgi:hypothetical protein